jgi:hypothetical protein
MLHADITASVFGGTKELYLTGDGKSIFAKDELYTLFAGADYPVANKVYFSTSAGLGFISSSIFPAVKAGFIIFPGKSKKVFTEMFFNNIFQHDNISNQSFGYLSAGLGIKLF